MTSIPALIWNPDTGPVLPPDSDILDGALSDWNTAVGYPLNPALETPQGQMASSLSAIISDNNSQWAALINNIDPATSSGLMQDAIGNIYFMTRNPAQATAVNVLCVGLVDTPIPIGTQVQDSSQNIYTCVQSGNIPASGNITLEFQNNSYGPIPCPAGTITGVYRAIPGLDAVSNVADGVLGNVVESRADFEYRRYNSVAKNANGTMGAVMGAVFAVPGVLDCYATQNTSGLLSGASCTGSISNNTLTITASPDGIIESGQMVVGANVIAGTYINGLGSGSGGAGTYTVNISQSVASESLICAVGGIQLLPNSIYIAAYGGNSQLIANAIYTKKGNGADYNGNTTVTVMGNDNGLYTLPYPSYKVTFNVPTPTPILFNVLMQNSTGVPANAMALIKAAITKSFNGLDGGQPARIGSVNFASRYYYGIASLGQWAMIYEIKLGITTANLDSVLLRIDQVPTLSDANISVSFS